MATDEKLPSVAILRKEKKRGWELHSGLVEIFWKNGYADRVRIMGATFYYISGKRRWLELAAVMLKPKPQRRKPKLGESVARKLADRSRARIYVWWLAWRSNIGQASSQKIIRDYLETEFNEAIRATKEGWIDTLGVHWLANIECFHIIRSDVATCACGWKSPTLPTVGSAVTAWARHVSEFVDDSAIVPYLSEEVKHG